MNAPSPAPAPRPAARSGYSLLRGAAAVLDLATMLVGRRAAPVDRDQVQLHVNGRDRTTCSDVRPDPSTIDALLEQAKTRLARGDALEVSTRVLGTRDAAVSRLGIGGAFAAVVLVLRRGRPGSGRAMGRDAGPAVGGCSSGDMLQRQGEVLWKQLADVAFPPTRVVFDEDRAYLFYALSIQVPPNQEWNRALFRMQNVLAAFIPGLSVLGPDPWIPLTGLLESRDPRILPAGLLVPARARRWRPEDVIERGEGLLRLLREADAARQPRPHGPPPPEMALRTLPPLWDLADLAVSRDLRARLAEEATAGMGPLSAETIRSLVRAMARAGHGWPDVEAVLQDPRWRLQVLLEFKTTTLLGLKRHFRACLAERPVVRPVRLPHGVWRIEQVPGAHPGEEARYRLVGRNDGRPFAAQVSWRTLQSPTATAHAIGAALQTSVQPTALRTWRWILRLALADPRLTGTARPALGPDRTPLSEHIRRFLAAARPPPERGEEVLRALSSTDPAGWPLVRDGEVVFPRSVLEQYLHGRNLRFRRSELTLAITALAGGPRGIKYFGPGKRIRVWACPIQPPEARRNG